MKKFNNFSILRSGKIFLLTLATWLTMAPSWSQESETTESGYLGFTATEGNTTVRLNKKGSPNSINLQYSKNGGNWTNYTVGNDINLKQGEKVEFKAPDNHPNTTFSKLFGYHNAKASGMFDEDEDYLTGDFYYFSFSNNVEASGNVATLLSSGSISSLPDYAFAGLFQNCTTLLSAPSLPDASVALSKYCYAGMFFQCTKIQSAPELPATTLKDHCYTYMFAGCERLQSINVGFTSWGNYTENWVYSTKKSATAFWVRTDNINHPFSATGGIFHKPEGLKFESNESRIPKGWTIPSDKDYLFFSWNSKIQETSAFEGLINTVLGWLFGGGSSGNSIYATISLNQNVPYNVTLGDNNIQLEYSKNGYNWTPWTWSSKSIQLDYGESCYIRSAQSNYKFSTKDRYRYFSIELSDDASDKLSSLDLGCICVTGNVMSLLDKNVLTNEVPEYGFYKLFQNNVNIFNAPTLPATDLNPHCYESMFEGCTKLNAAPNLPATTEQIEEAVAEGCYNNMFKGCSKIDYIKVGFNKWIFDNLNTNNSTFEITKDWVNGVTTSGGTFRCPEGLNLDYSDSRIPTSWRGSSNVGPIDEKKDWLCFELTSNFGTVKLDRSSAELNNLTDKLQYSFTGTEGSWNNYTWADKKGQQIDLNAKEGLHRVYFRSTVTDGSGQCSVDWSKYYYFSLTGMFEASGNVMSLIDSECQRVDVKPSEFYSLFIDCKTLRSAPKLPATKLAATCYQQLFKGCLQLINLPELPALVMKDNCYKSMFEDCKSITYAPALEATSLANNCYRRMFANCIKLQNAPELPAKDLVSECYKEMFINCNSLEYINAGFLDWQDESISDPEKLPTKDWVNGVANTGIFVCDAEIANDPQYGVNKIPHLDEDGKRWTPVSISTANLYFEAKRNGSTIKLNKVGDLSENVIHLQYSTDDGKNWNDYTWTGKDGLTIELNLSGRRRVYFRTGQSSNASYIKNEKFSKSETDYYNFVMKGSFDAKGSIMSLLHKDITKGSDCVPEWAFVKLFNNCGALQSAPLLPATRVNAHGYQRLFESCRTLRKAPSLPALTLEEACYKFMFARCSNLTEAPELNAKEIPAMCYQGMFLLNTSLIYAPHLPAEQLKYQCYEKMFAGCSNLQYMSVGFKNWQITSTDDWVAEYNNTPGVKDYGIFNCPEELPHDINASVSNYGNSRIPKEDIDGKRWQVNVPALRFIALNTSYISIIPTGNPANVALEYSTDNAKSWNDYSYNEEIRLKEGENFFIRAKGTYTAFSKDANNYYQFHITGSVTTEGSIMSLLNKEATGDIVPEWCFYNLFKDCEGLTNIPQLPATTLYNYAYRCMFQNCGITEVESLAATSLGDGCYLSMFQDCKGLRKAPSLNAETLRTNCYNSMFKGCTSLTEAPKLNATVLASNCYNSMFMNCSNLRIAPNLPATTLVSGCYANMFSGCSKLSEISVEFSAWTPDGATTNWVSGVANEGIFSCPNNLDTTIVSATRVPKDDSHKWKINPDFLGFKATTDATIALNKVGTPHAAYLIYSVNSKSRWKNYSWDGQNGLTIQLNAGESVYFKAENDYNAADTTDPNNPVPNKMSKDADNYYQFSITGSVAASGTASFLLGRTTNNQEVPAYGFYKLFAGCTALTSAPEVSPNTTANAHAYESMFEGCSNMTTSPDSLPATSIAVSCYESMFEGCSNMTTSPETLPATTLAESCYKNMFKGCEKMATSPDALPATSVVESCYESMFEGDSLITRIPTLGVSTTSAVAAYKNMFKGCKSMTSDNMPSSLFNNNSVSESFYEGMFDGCSTIEKAEFDLPAGGLAKACYKNMFRGCSSLTKVPPTFGTPWNIIESCYEGMFEGCSSLETAPTLSWTKNAATTSFKNMFKGCSALRNNIPSAMSSNLATSCYESMFEGCESLTTAPTLPTSSNQLTEGCYKAMFKGCTSLTTPPELPANVMYTSCYESMFEGCTELTTAPTVYNSTLDNEFTLATACWKNMFKNCSKLTGHFNLLSKEIKESCFEGMFENCTSLTTAPSLPMPKGKEYLANKCYYRMFAGCTNLTAAPELPAKSDQLRDSCYAYMFNGCTRLHYIDVSFRDWHFDDLGATYLWVDGVAPSGTFMCPEDLVKTYGKSHIPTGWSAEDNGDYLCITALEQSYNLNLQFERVGTPYQISYKYSTDKKNWTAVNGGSYAQMMGNVQAGRTVFIKITDGRLSKDATNYWKFTSSGGAISVSGNIMSLLDASMERTDVPDYAFYKLFSGCPNITDISGLELPATEVGAYAYANMFEGCSTLKANATSTPELPATTLGEYCYQNLFEGWTALTSAPELPATTLEPGCYSGMFKGCTSLTTAPVLPATTLVKDCYDNIFDECPSLNYINVAFTAWVEDATDNWVNKVANSGTLECPWDLCQDAKDSWGIANAYGGSKIPKDNAHKWIILTHTDMTFNYKTGELTISGGSPIYWSTDENLKISNCTTVGTKVENEPAVVDCNEWLNATITSMDSITYYALALIEEESGFDNIQPTVNSLTIYRHPKKIDMCICDTEEEFETAMYYANKVSSANYPVKVLIEDGEYDFGNKSFEVGEYVSVIGESLNGTILKSSSDKGVLNIKGNDAYLQDMKLVNTGSGAAFTNKGQHTTLHVAMEGYYNEGGMTKHYLPESWTRATDPTQATISAASVNGSSISLTSNAKYFLVRVDDKYAFANSSEFHLVESIAGKNVTVRAANNRGAFGEPITPTLITADGLTEYNKVTVKLNGYGFSSFCFDDANVDQLQVIGASVYKGIYREGAVYLVRLNEHDIVPKRTGVILAGLQNSTVSFYENNSVLLSDEESNPYNYLPDEKCIGMSGNWSTETIVNNGHNYYVLSNTYGGFRPLKKDGGTIKPNKAYFDLGNETNASSVRIVFGMWEEEEEEVVSGINYLPTAGSDSEYSYSLTGVRTKDAKGLVIQNNKVVLIK